MKTSIFNMNFTLPPMVGMVEVEKDMPHMVTATNCIICPCPWACQETDMKTSIFNMTLTLPPLVEITEVEKNMPMMKWPTLPMIFIDCQESDMKTSIFDMSFTLPPMVEITQVEKDMPMNTRMTPMLCFGD